MKQLSFYEFPDLRPEVQYDPELEVFTIRLVTDGSQLVLVLTPRQLSVLADRMLEAVIDSPEPGPKTDKAT
jgi:hypothetical protein